MTGCWSKIICYLISPGTIKWMLCNTHQFHMSISHIFHISCQLMCNLSVIIESILIFFCLFMLFPGTRMYFIYKHWILFIIKFLSLLHPSAVMPLKIRNVCHNRSIVRTEFCLKSIRVCF